MKSTQIRDLRAVAAVLRPDEEERTTQAILPAQYHIGAQGATAKIRVVTRRRKGSEEIRTGPCELLEPPEITSGDKGLCVCFQTQARVEYDVNASRKVLLSSSP